MSYESGKRLEIYRIVEGLADCMRDNDIAGVQYCREALSLAMQYAGDGDPAKRLHETLEELFMVSGDWQRGVVIRRDNPAIKRHVFDLIDRAMTLIAKARW